MNQTALDVFLRGDAPPVPETAAKPAAKLVAKTVANDAAKAAAKADALAAAKAAVAATPVGILVVGDGLGDDPFEFEDPDDAFPKLIVALALPPPDDVPAPISAAAVLMPNLPPPWPSLYCNLPGFLDILVIC